MTLSSWRGFQRVPQFDDKIRKLNNSSLNKRVGKMINQKLLYLTDIFQQLTKIHAAINEIEFFMVTFTCMSISFTQVRKT